MLPDDGEVCKMARIWILLCHLAIILLENTNTNTHNKPLVFCKFDGKQGLVLCLDKVVTFINGQCIEFGSAEELSQRNTETVAEFLYVDCAGILAFAEKNALDGGLGNTGYFAHLVGRYIVLLTKLLDSSGDNLLCVHIGIPRFLIFTGIVAQRLNIFK